MTTLMRDPSPQGQKVEIVVEIIIGLRDIVARRKKIIVINTIYPIEIGSTIDRDMNLVLDTDRVAVWIIAERRELSDSTDQINLRKVTSPCSVISEPNPLEIHISIIDAITIATVMKINIIAHLKRHSIAPSLLAGVKAQIGKLTVV